MHDVPLAEDPLSGLGLSPADVCALPDASRKSLIAYLLRWEHFHTARVCLESLLVTHSHLVSIYDAMARAHLGMNEPDLAVEVMRLRNDIRSSSTSQARATRAQVAAGDLAGAQAIASKLVEEHPHMLTAWSLQADVCIAAGDFDGAERALRQREALRPESPATAHGLARLWEARGDAEKALLWARTAVGRSERDERPPAVYVMRLLEKLYRATDQHAQADATAARLSQRQESEWADLRERLAPEASAPRTQPISQDEVIVEDLGRAESVRGAESAQVTGEVGLTADERSRLDEALRRDFPHEAFRPGQADVIAAVLRGESVLAVMPTGAGKSLCYQLAALELPATTLVISPLIALMKDQLDGLPEGVGPRATTLNSTLEGRELETRLARAAHGRYKLLYAAPERLRQRPFLHCLSRAGVSLLVVDEAHCVSLWGHDFRPDYLFIAKAWKELGRPPILAMTATATARVRDDIGAALRPMRLVATDVHRPNLRLEARRYADNEEKMRALLALCKEIKGSGIVYANSREKCETLASLLQRKGISAMHYHAGIDDRAAAQDRFMGGSTRVVVATIAFGMGVDKADVRFIIHYDPPKTLENYFQEAGRAGRDGLPARCILFHTSGSKGVLTRWSRMDALHVDWLRQVYAAVRRRLGAEGEGIVALGDLERDLAADTTRIRVAIHFLETAGLVWRGFDLPRTASLTLLAEPLAGGADSAPAAKPRFQDDVDPQFVRFAKAARLPYRQAISRVLVSTSRDAGLDPRTIEAKLLAWNDAGLLRYRGIGRDMYLALPEPPPDSQARVAAMVADHRAGQDARIADIMSYAATETCRHGFISAHFGGRSIERCEACDNCLGLAAPAPRAATRRPTIVDPVPVILRAMTRLPHRMGTRALSRMLSGSVASSAHASRSADFGTLQGIPLSAIKREIDGLVEEGLVAYYVEDNFRLLRLTSEGRAVLEGKRMEQQPASPSAPSSAKAAGGRGAAGSTPRKPGEADETGEEVDEELYERLRAWRLEVARENELSPYVVFHNAVLRSIAAHCPTTLNELEAIKGIGPKKRETYGHAVLAIVAGGAAVSPDDAA
jgi:ATP-dependent DNA helicase RecQ